MRMFWLSLGWTAVAFGAIGAFLPVVPTVPFLLVAAWAFSRSSPALRERIRSHPRYGAAVRAWQDRGVVAPLAKIWAVVAMTAGVLLGLWLQIDPRIVATQAAICAVIGIYVVSRPSR